VTLRVENLLWLRGHARASRAKSISEVVDAVIAAARTSGRPQDGTTHSVKGTIQIADSDPALLGADAAVRALFAKSRAVAGKQRAGSDCRRRPRGATRRST